MSCEDIPSLLDLQNTKKHVDDFGRLIGTGTGTSTNEVTGQERPTYNQVMSNLGYTRVGTFAAGATLLNGRQTLLWDIADGGDGQEYGWSGQFLPSGKVVPPGSTPLTTGGISVGAWMSRFDPELKIIVFEALRRSYAEVGYNLIGTFSNTGLVVTTVTNVVLWEPTGIAYAYSGTLPHTLGAGETPIGNPLWVDKSDVLVTDKLKFIVPNVDVTGVTDETSKISQLLADGYSVKLPPGKIKANIQIRDGSVLIGSGAPRYNTATAQWDSFGTVVIGRINTSNKKSWTIGNLSIDSFAAGENGVTGVGAGTGFGYTKNVNTRANNHGMLFESACPDPLVAYNPANNVIGNIVAEDCEHWGGPNGYVSKHHRVKFIRCKTWGVTVQGFVAASDNINAATSYNRATETLFEDCYSDGVGLGVGNAEGVRVYTQDRFSADPANDVNTNSVQPADSTWIVGYRSERMAGSSIRVGDNESPTTCNLPSTKTFVDGWKYATFAFSGITLQHSSHTIISRSEFGLGPNVSVSQTRASGVIIDDSNIWLGGGDQSGAETGRVVVNNNSNTIKNRHWVNNLTYVFQNTANTTVNTVEFSIYNKPVRFVIDDVFTGLDIFGAGVTIKGKGTIVDACFDGVQWQILEVHSSKTKNELVLPYAASVTLDYLNIKSTNIYILIGGNLTAINAVVEGMQYGETVALRIESDGTNRTLGGWGSNFRFAGSSTINNLGNPPTSLAAFTKLYIEFYVVNGLLIEKFRASYA